MFVSVVKFASGRLSFETNQPKRDGIMTTLLPPESSVDRLLKRLGHPRAYFMGGMHSTYGIAKALPEPVWRSVLRKRGKPAPNGWMYRQDEDPPGGSNG